ncbi:hypothetical protein GCM10022419_054690 [Nonomuraea rosea]|uniref:DUF4253 domain-containing protein n=1 Tax=Nonomuraea rosea TaxID=638574 RepID=A0ABP6XH01_9ACTN
MSLVQERLLAPELADARPLFRTPMGVEITGVPLSGIPVAERLRMVLATRALTQHWPMLIDAALPTQLEYHWTLPDIAMPLKEVLARANGLSPGDEPDARPANVVWPEFGRTERVARPASAPGGLLPGESQVYLALMPVESGWQVPGLLSYGGWNRYPEPVAHTALLRDWYRRFGAELVAMTDCTAEFVVRRPPRTRAGAWALAWELLRYSDAVRGKSPDAAVNFAADLLGAGHWVACWR